MYGLLYNLGRVGLGQGDHGTARARFKESLAICRELGFKGGIGNALLGLAMVAHRQGDDEAARALLDEAGAQDPGSYACIQRGHVLLEMNDYAAARSCYEEGLALRRAAGDTQSAASSLVEVGHVAWLQGEHGVTRSNALEALGLFQERGNKEGLPIVLESLGVAALAEGRKEHAARLLGAVAALREARELPAAPWWHRPRERFSEAVRAASLEQAFGAAWAEGKAMALEQAIRCALEEADG
jgi:tetratricopeptide (TPR) repeat protein